MTTARTLALGIAAAVTAFLIACASQTGSEINIGDSDLGGVVTSAAGPEAGVWVIAETTGLPTKYAKMVVTDDRWPLRHPRSAESDL
jgi:hypothetical protein